MNGCLCWVEYSCYLGPSRQSIRHLCALADYVEYFVQPNMKSGSLLSLFWSEWMRPTVGIFSGKLFKRVPRLKLVLVEAPHNSLKSETCKAEDLKNLVAVLFVWRMRHKMFERRLSIQSNDFTTDGKTDWYLKLSERLPRVSILALPNGSEGINFMLLSFLAGYK